MEFRCLEEEVLLVELEWKIEMEYNNEGGFIFSDVSFLDVIMFLVDRRLYFILVILEKIEVSGFDVNLGVIFIISKEIVF